MSSSEDDFSDFSENDAPEDVSFKISKENALNSIKSIKESISKDKQVKKQQRQAIELRNIEQKKHKALSKNFLDQVDRTIEEKTFLKRTLNDKESKRNQKKSKIASRDNINVYTGNDNDDVIPLARTKRYTKKPELVAMDFKQKILYRSGSHRISTAESINLKKKRLQRLQGR